MPPTATATVTHAAAARQTRELRSHLRPRQQHTDADVYAGIARAWCSMHRPGEHYEHPMRPFLVDPGFTEEVWGRRDVDPHDVLAVCGKLVALADYQVREQATMTQKCDGLTESLDPVRGFWLALPNTPGLGLHFWQLVVVPVELLCIGPVDDPPALRYGRFAERAARARLRAVPA